MKYVNIFKAATIGRTMEVESITIDLHEEFPEFKTIDEHSVLFEKEALTLADALLDALPGGTIDRLLAELLRRKSTSFVVPLFGRDHVPRSFKEEVVLSDEERGEIARAVIKELKNNSPR